MPYLDFTATGVYGAPQLVYPSLTIPIHLTQYQMLNRALSTRTITSIPDLSSSTNLAWGGLSIGQGVAQLPKMTLGGWIDTPKQNAGTQTQEQFQQSSFTQAGYSQDGSGSGTWHLSYAEYIIACMEGRMQDPPARVEPLSYRDPFGRQFNNPRVFDFNASFVEQVPGRNNFTMILQV